MEWNLKRLRCLILSMVSLMDVKIIDHMPKQKHCKRQVTKLPAFKLNPNSQIGLVGGSNKR